jgi:lysozyme
VSLQFGRRGVQVLSHFEGRANYAYVDPVGVCTVGVGHALKPHRSCTASDYLRYGTRSQPKMTDGHVDTVLRRDVEFFASGVRRLVRKGTAQHEFDAMVCLAINIGLGGFASSTVLRMHNRRRSFAAGVAFLLWVRGGGVVLPGLSRRRRSERFLYRKGKVRTFG